MGYRERAMRTSVVVSAAAIFGLITGIAVERVREHPEVAPVDARPGLANEAAFAPRAPAVAAGRLRTAAAPTDGAATRSAVGQPDRVGVPPAVVDVAPAGDPRIAPPRRTRQQRAVSAQIDAMAARLRDHSSAPGERADEAAAVAPPIRVSDARAVLKGMLEGFAAAAAPSGDSGTAGESRPGEENDGRTTR